MNKKLLKQFLNWLALVGNFIFILWITYNGIDEGFAGTMPQKASYLSLVVLLLLNILLLWQRGDK